MFKASLRAAVISVFWVVIALYFITQVIELTGVIERDLQRQKRPLFNRTSPAPSVIYAHTPVQQLLHIERQQKLLSREQYQLAQQVQAHAVASVHSDFSLIDIVSREQALQFLQVLGRYIDNHYVYQTGVPLGLGLIRGVLDCDMRVFLYLSVAESLGFNDFYFVLAPGHALVGWQLGDGEPLLWETTSRLGNIAELGNSALYQPVTSKRYGDYQLASTQSQLLQSQLTAAVAWSLSKSKQPEALTRALTLFDRSLQQFNSANIGAAKVLLGSRDLVAAMPLSQAYSNYAKTYPNAQGAQLYQLAVLLQNSSSSDAARALEHADALLSQGVVSPVVEAVYHRYGNAWQCFNAVELQHLAQTLGRVLYPSQPFLRERDSVAEGRAFMVAAMLVAMAVVALRLLLFLFIQFTARRN